MRLLKMLSVSLAILSPGLIAQDYVKYWDSWHERIHDDFCTGQTELDLYYYKSIENIITKYCIFNNASILDVGSGNGHWIEFVKNQVNNTNIIALDISVEAIYKLKAKFSDVRCLVCDFGNPVYFGKFDYIFAIGVLHHIVEDSKFQQALQNIHANLSKDGIAVISTEFTDNLFVDKGIVYKKYRVLDEWKQRLALAGLSIINFHIQKHEKYRKLPNDILIIKRR